MNKKQFYTLFCAACLYASLPQMQAYASDDHDRAEHGVEKDHKNEHEDEQSTRITDEMAAQVGIKTAHASSQLLRQNIIAYGSLSNDPQQLSHVRARYSGLIKSVKSTIGDIVKKGDLLAQVESNESLKTYQILAPISGMIIQRHANTGEVTLDQVLFSIADFNTLWAEFRIYPTQQSRVKKGQRVTIDVEGLTFKGQIAHVIPTQNKPYQLARVKFDNHSNSLSPGLLVEGHVTVGEFKVNQAVKKEALQTMGVQRGVFVKTETEYQFTPLLLGRSDDRYIEVLSGLDTEQSYVSENSYLLKADIEKSEAEHDD